MNVSGKALRKIESVGTAVLKLGDDGLIYEAIQIEHSNVAGDVDKLSLIVTQTCINDLLDSIETLKQDCKEHMAANCN